MRRLTTMVALIAVLGLVGVCLAKEKKTASGTGVVASPRIAKAAPDVKPTTVTERATITKIDGANVTFTIQMPADAGTRVSVDGATKTLADLKVGQTAMVTLNENTLTAIAVTLPVTPAAETAPASK
jgi:hypothetical protein